MLTHRPGNDVDCSHTSAFPRHKSARVMHRLRPSKSGGRRETGCASRTRGSHAKKKRRRYAETAALPAQWFTAYTHSPRSPGLLASVACRFAPADLIPASGNQDHAISLVRRHIARLALRPRPSLPASRVVTFAIRPSCSRRDARIRTRSSEKRKTNIFRAAS